MPSVGRRLGVLQSHLQRVGSDSNAAGCSTDAQLEQQTCRAAPPATVAAPVLVGGMVMDLQVSHSSRGCCPLLTSDVRPAAANTTQHTSAA